MLKRIIVKPDTWSSEIFLFKEIGDFSKLNVLMGPNGIGKSTILRHIEENLKGEDFRFGTTKYKPKSIETDKICSTGIDLCFSEKIEKCNIIRYFNGKDNFIRKPNDPFTGQIDFMRCASGVFSSEGENILMSFSEFIYELLPDRIDNDSLNIILIDEIDSGLSIENINAVCNSIVETINKYSNIQFFITANNFHFVYYFKDFIYWVEDGKKTIFENYESFFKRYIKARKKLLKIRK